MITHLRGNIFEINPSVAVIDCNGIGYMAHISLFTYSAIQDKKDIHLFVQPIVREDSHTLYGFHTKTERELFNLLISVSGIGPASAMVMLSSMGIDEIATSIANGDSATLQTIKGIGAKTAQRIVIDLRDKLITFKSENGEMPLEKHSIKKEALQALEVLGVASKNTGKIIEKIVLADPEISVEDLIKNTLKAL